MNNLEFLNRRSLPFELDNVTDDVAEQSVTQKELVHLEITAEIPLICLMIRQMMQVTWKTQRT